MNLDETMSQDTAFTSENQDKETFKFDEVKETSPESHTNEENKEEVSDDSASPVGTESEEQKVPYSRFKKKVDELNETSSRIEKLEEQLEELRNNHNGQKQQEDSMPDEWIELYGNSEASQKAWAIQQRREQDLEERIIRQSLETVQRQQYAEAEQLAENEDAINSNLEELQEAIGRKFTARQEEAILGIVDEFSPVGSDGKYVTLFPFDKAYEIYNLRQSQLGQGTRQARQNVADLTGNNSEGDVGESSAQFKRGWDSWRDGL